jgi:hypothetical protein
VRQYKLPTALDKWALVSVSWEDAMTDSGPHQSEAFVTNFKPCIRRASGYVVGYTPDYIFLAAHDDRDSNVDQDCEDITVIPIPYVRRITRKR